MENILQILSSLQDKYVALEKKVDIILKENQELKKEIEILKNSSQETTTKPNQLISIKKINKHLKKYNLHEQNVSCICNLSQNRIGTASVDGSISISVLDCLLYKFVQDVKKTKAHDGKINCLCMLDENRFISCSDDTTIKVWDMSSLKKLPLIMTIKGHIGQIEQVIQLTNNRFASCSYNDGTVKLWDSNIYTNIPVPFETLDYSPCSMLQLKKEKETLAICCGSLLFYNLSSPFNLKGEITGIFTQQNMIELSHGHLAVPVIGAIYVIDPVKYTKVCEIKDNEHIPVFCGSLCELTDNSFMYVCEGSLCQVVYENEEYKINYSTKDNKNELSHSSGIVPVNNGSYFLVGTKNNKHGVNVYKIDY